jgi:hypothetical protein
MIKKLQVILDLGPRSRINCDILDKTLGTKNNKFVAPLVKLLFKLKFSYRYAGACP